MRPEAATSSHQSSSNTRAAIALLVVFGFLGLVCIGLVTALKATEDRGSLMRAEQRAPSEGQKVETRQKGGVNK